MQSELFWQGLELMLVGMGTVFAFLTILVIATGLMSRLVLRLSPITKPEGPPTMAEMAAIVAAIAAYRQAPLEEDS